MHLLGGGADSGGPGALVFNTFPLILSLLSWAAGAERPTRRMLAMMPVALAGLALALDAGGWSGRNAAGLPPLGRDRRRRFARPGRGPGLRHRASSPPAGWPMWMAACAAS
jgi:drug/metabolite transporter (DMT)-like permease